MVLKKSELQKLSIYGDREQRSRISSHENSKTIQVLTRHGSNFLPRDSLFDSSNDLKTTDDASSYDSF